MIFVKNVRVELKDSEGRKLVDMDADVAVKFYHRKGSDTKNRGRSTRCELIAVEAGKRLTYENGIVIAAGETKVFAGNYWTPADQFNRRVGRKMALERALENSGFDKATRSVFWQMYHLNCKS